MTLPGTRPMAPGAIVVVSRVTRSNPTAPFVWYSGRGRVGSMRWMETCIKGSCRYHNALRKYLVPSAVPVIAICLCEALLAAEIVFVCDVAQLFISFVDEFILLYRHCPEDIGHFLSFVYLHRFNHSSFHFTAHFEDSPSFFVVRPKWRFVERASLIIHTQVHIAIFLVFFLARCPLNGRIFRAQELSLGFQNLRNFVGVGVKHPEAQLVHR